MSTRITASATPYDTLPRRYTNLTGRRIGQLTVQRPIRKQNTLYWECLCDCGNHCLRRTYQLTGPHPKRTHCSHCHGTPPIDWDAIIHDNHDYISKARTTTPRH